jgi:heme/copper-type cytochrome/quinol oxidase subunit 2
MIHVTPPPTAIGFGNFPTSLADLFVRVLEGMATVAVVVLPVAGVLAVVIIPFRRKKGRAEVRQS